MMLKKWTALLLALCLLPIAAMADAVRMEDITALREHIAQLRAELEEKENRLEDMQRLYKIQNSNRRIVFETEEWTLLNGHHVLLKPEVIRVKEDAPTKTVLRWESSDSSVVWIDRETGRAYAKGPGTAEITCWAQDDRDVFAVIAIHVIEPVESIRLSPETVLLAVREENGVLTERNYLRMQAAVKPENAGNKTLHWTSDNEDVVRVLESGMLIASGIGTATVKAQAQDGSGEWARVTVKVVRGLEEIVLNHGEATVNVGKKLRLSAEILPENAGEKKLVWQSSDETVATVTTKGVVFAEKPGVCTITATATDGTGVTAECIVTVVK